MKKNYYEILEISENASQEIVEKAYKTLAMKYHPDLQTGEEKTEYEEKLKQINEAYSVLKEKEKRAEYDKTLEIEKQRDNLAAQRIAQKLEDANSEENVASEQEILRQTAAKQQEIINQAVAQQQEALKRAAVQQQEAINQAYQKAYNDAYVQELRRRGIKVKYKKPFKAYVPFIIAIAVLILIFVLLWQIPPIRNYIIEICNNNVVLRIILSPLLR